MLFLIPFLILIIKYRIIKKYKQQSKMSKTITHKCLTVRSRKQSPFYSIVTREMVVNSVDILLQVVYFSVDPVMKFFLAGARTYFHPVEIDGIMNCFGIARVIQGNEEEGFNVGDYVFGNTGACDYIVLDEQRKRQCFVVEKELVEMYGMPTFLYLINNGLAAYAGYEIMQPKQTDTVVVSTASGATGILLCQLLKKKGVRVVGLTSAHKIEQLKPYTDVTINYQNQQQLSSKLKQQKFQCYFDNVGEHMLDLALQLIQPYGRIALCGAIANYTNYNNRGIKNTFMLITKRLRMEGLTFMHMMPKAKQIFQEYSGVEMTIIEIKMQQFQHYFTELLKSGNNILGKVIVKL